MPSSSSSASEGGGGGSSRGKGGDDSKYRQRQLVSPAIWAVLVLGMLVTGAWFVSIRFFALPQPAAAATTPASAFSAERAMRHVQALAGDIGYRLVGSKANEEQTPEYLVAQVDALQAAAAEQGWRLEVDVQKATGAFSFTFLFAFFTNAYTNITNIVVRLSPKDASEDAMQHALLISSHFDSTLGTPGASDASVGIAVMLEVMNNLVHSPATLPHPIIFNFNGAEESFMQAAHGFITQHAWADTVKAFINLEAAGTGGPEILFQTGPKHSWLAHAYAKACPYPHGTVLAQDLFQTDVLAGDTDFRIYRDFGPDRGYDGSHAGDPGFDMAFYHHGHVYHTHMDTPANVPPGSVQHMGSNVLALIPEVLRAPAFVDHSLDSEDHPVFFDVFQYTMVLVGHRAMYALYAAIALGTLAFVSVMRPIGAGVSVGAEWGAVVFGAVEALGSLFVAVLFALAAAALLNLGLGVSMPWYSRPYFMFLLYGLPAILGIMLVNLGCSTTLSSATSPGSRHVTALLGVGCLYACGMLGLAFAGLGTAYLMAMNAACCVGGVAVQTLMQRMRHKRDASDWAACTVIASAIPATYGMYMACGLATIVMALLGKAGRAHPIVGEVVIGTVAAVMGYLVLGTVAPALHRLRRAHVRRAAMALGAVWLVSAIAAAMVHPYDKLHPKRLIVMHLHEVEDAVLSTPGAEPAYKLVAAPVLASAFDPNPDAVFVKGIIEGAKHMKLGQLEVGPPNGEGTSARWQSWFPFHNFLRGVAWTSPAMQPHPRLARRNKHTPSVILVSDEVFPEGTAPTHPFKPDDPRYPFQKHVVHRRVRLGVYTGVPCWSTLNITAAGLVGWSVSRTLPDLTCEDGSVHFAHEYVPGEHHQRCSYVMRHAGGSGSESFEVWLEFDEVDAFTVDFATLIAGPHARVGQTLELFEQAIPEWASAAITFGTIQRFIVPPHAESAGTVATTATAA